MAVLMIQLTTMPMIAVANLNPEMIAVAVVIAGTADKIRLKGDGSAVSVQSGPRFL